MRKFLSLLILTSVLVLPISATNAQRTATKSKAASSTTAQRGVDTHQRRATAYLSIVHRVR